jgi:hypothetical protein
MKVRTPALQITFQMNPANTDFRDLNYVIMYSSITGNNHVKVPQVEPDEQQADFSRICCAYVLIGDHTVEHRIIGQSAHSDKPITVDDVGVIDRERLGGASEQSHRGKKEP